MTGLIVSLFLFLALASPVYTAPVSTPSSTPTSSISQEEVEKSLQQRIQKALENNLDTVKETIESTFGSEKIIAYIGKINSPSETSFTLVQKGKTNGSAHKQVLVTSGTAIIRSGKAIKLSDISLEDGIIAMGEVDDDGTMTAKRIVAYTIVPSKFNRRVIISEITAVDTAAKTVSFAQTGKDIFKLASRPVLTNSGHQTLKLNQFEVGDRVIAVLYTRVSTEVTTVSHLLALPANPPADFSSPVSTSSAAPAACGDGLCQSAEAPETCPGDCTNG